MKYYIDSNIFIYSVTEEEVGSKARNVLELVEKGGIKAATSVLTLDEVVWIVKQNTDRETAIETGRKLLKMENLEILPANAETGSGSLDLMEESILDPRDSLHLSTAEKHGIYSIITEDSDLENENFETFNTEEILGKIEQ